MTYKEYAAWCKSEGLVPCKEGFQVWRTFRKKIDDALELIAFNDRKGAQDALDTFKRVLR